MANKEERLVAADRDAKELESLAARAVRGDGHAFTELVERTHRTVYRVALRQTRSQSDAEDVAQETYIRAWNSLERLRDHGRVVGWLCRIARNVATDLLRERKRKPVESIDRRVGDGSAALVDLLSADQPSPEGALSSEQARAALTAIVDTIKEPYRTVLLLREVDGMTYDEIAVALDIPVGTVESRLFRARRDLAGKLARAAAREDL